MSEEKDLVLENTENAEEPTAEETVESEVSAAEEESETISYTQEELNQKVDEMVARKIARKESKIRREYEEKYAPYKEAERVLNAGLGTSSISEATSNLRKFYEEKGLEIPEDQNGGYSNDALKVLADNEAQKIIDYGLDEVIEEVDRLASKGAENMTPRERLVFANLAGYRKSEEEKRELAKIGVSEKTLEDEEFTDFAGKLNPSLSIKEKWELFNKYRPQKEIEPIGSMKSSGGADTGVKDFYTREEALKFTKEDFDKNPELYKAVDNSMKHWK